MIIKPKRGRPPTERGPYNPHPARQLGRVSGDDWRLLRQAAQDSGQNFTQWALAILLDAAKRQSPPATPPNPPPSG
jgi:hypothetical protein